MAESKLLSSYEVPDERSDNEQLVSLKKKPIKVNINRETEA